MYNNLYTIYSSGYDMKQIVNDVGERARNFYTSSENVSIVGDGCYHEIFYIQIVRL